MLAAAVLCFAHTVGEFGVVLMIGGSIPGVTRTLSIALYDQVMDGNYAASNHMALALVAISLAALLVVYSVARPGARGETAVREMEAQPPIARRERRGARTGCSVARVLHPSRRAPRQQ